MLLNGAATIDTNGQVMTIEGLVTTSGLTALNFDLTAPGGAAPLVIGPDGLVVAPHTAITFGSDPTVLGDYRLIGGNFGTPGFDVFRSSRRAGRRALLVVDDRGSGLSRLGRGGAGAFDAGSLGRRR